MIPLNTNLTTPIYLKTSPDAPWPPHKVFYLLTSNGLQLCRNHDFFKSCVLAPRGPSELCAQEPFHEVSYPKLPKRDLEMVVGFFDRVWSDCGGEAVVALAWNTATCQAEIVVPQQTTTVSRDRYGAYPISLTYQPPSDLPSELRLFGDIHSHCDMAAYTSHIDAQDEARRCGLHIVVGRLHQEPPQFHVEAVVDGRRFAVSTEFVLDGYERRRWDFNHDWLDRVDVRQGGYKSNGTSNQYGDKP